MAYVDDTILQEDESEQGGPTIAGSGQSGSMSAPTAQGKAKSKTPGNFADLSEYLRVNKDQNFGQTLAGKVGSEIDQGAQTLTDAEQQFKDRVESNTITDKNDAITKTIQNPMGDTVQDFVKLRDAEYKGPRTLSDTADLQNRVMGSVGTATGKAAATGTEGGRFALLNSYFGRPQYNQGQKSLDNLLIQNDPNSKQAFEQLQERSKELSQNASALNPRLQQYGGQGEAQTIAARNAARNAIGIDDSGALVQGGLIGSERNKIADRFSAENARLQKEYDSALSAAQKSKFDLSPEFLAAMGMNFDGKGYGTDATRYLGKNAVTKEGVTTADEAARLRALENLGLQSSFLDESANFGSDIGKKGYSFDEGNYQKARVENQQAYGKQMDEYNKNYADKLKAYEQYVVNAPEPKTFLQKQWRDQAIAGKREADEALAKIKAQYLGAENRYIPLDRTFGGGIIKR